MSVLDQFKLDHKLALITGAAGLLGQQHALAILEAGGRVILADINQSSLDQSVTLYENFKERYLPLVLDITQESDIQVAKTHIYDHFGKHPNILINNAAIDPKFDKSAPRASRIENFSLAEWNLELSVGLTGAFLCSKHFGIEMAGQKGGVILNIASDLGVIAPDQRLYQREDLSADQQAVKPVTYSVIKSGLIGLTRYLATYWPNENVRCNALAPGGVFNDHSPEFVDKLTHLIPMGRMATLSEYQAAIVFLCSEASAYMNGAVLVMDGGRSTW